MSSDFSLLLVASVPPPVAGQSIATALLLDQLVARGVEHVTVDLSREFHIGNRALSYGRRALDVASLPFRALAASRKLNGRPRIFYLQLGQSVQAMLRDLPILEVARALDWPVVGHVHGGGFRKAYDAAPAPVRIALARALRKLERVIVLSASLRSLFVGLLPPEKISVVPNGVEQVVADRAASLGPRSCNGSKLTVLYLSNLFESKGYIDVLEAARIANERGLPLEFELAGNVVEGTRIDPEAFIAQHDLTNTRYLGPMFGEDKLKLLADADVFVLPSNYPVEGQPIAMLEAMHFGLPIITTHIGGIRDTITDGVNGRIVSFGDPAAIVSSLEGMCSDRDLMQRMSATNIAAANADYTPVAHGEAMVGVFADVASGRSA